MTDHHIQRAEQAYEAHMDGNDRLERKIKEFLPEVLANPSGHDLDVYLLESGDFLEFLQATMRGDSLDLTNLINAFRVLEHKYRKLAEEEAEELAHEAIAAEDADKGYVE